MDDLFGILLFLIFILAPIIEQIRKRGTQPQKRPPTPTRLPQPRQQLPQQRSQTEEVSGKQRDAASVLIPDDLWTILTGEQRPTLPTPPPQEPPRKSFPTVYIPPEETEDEEKVAAEDVNVEVARTSREAVKREHAQRHRPPLSLEEEVRIVSLETELPSPAQRHAAFHEKIAASTPAAPKSKKKALLNMSDRSEVRRAFILQEVLGKPRGLE